jgi:hypothetical protein
MVPESTSISVTGVAPRVAPASTLVQRIIRSLSVSVEAASDIDVHLARTASKRRDERRKRPRLDPAPDALPAAHVASAAPPVRLRP